MLFNQKFHATSFAPIRQLDVFRVLTTGDSRHYLQVPLADKLAVIYYIFELGL